MLTLQSFLHRMPKTVSVIFGGVIIFALPERAFPQESLFQSRLDDVKQDSLVQVYQITPDTYVAYNKPRLFDFIGRGLQDIGAYSQDVWKRDNITSTGMSILATLGFLLYDQKIYRESQKLGERLNLSSENYLKTYISVKGYPIFQGPSDLGSALYFLGDGWVHASIAAAFLCGGVLKNDYRALQTFSQLAEGLISTGTSTQILKHVTGRESPFVSTVPGGKWTFFPDQIEYHKHVPRFDAFPSGHLATAMMTLTVIADNYPEKKFIRPVGYSLLTLLGFQMLNNGVHWMSDYPLSLTMGYYFGKIAVNRGRKVINTSGGSMNVSGKKSRANLHIYPYSPNRLLRGVSLVYSF